MLGRTQKVRGFDPWPRTSTPQHQQGGSYSMCLPLSPSLSVSGYLKEPKKALPPPASGGALGADPPPYHRSAAQKWRVCATKKAVALQSWRVCSRSAQTPSSGLNNLTRPPALFDRSCECGMVVLETGVTPVLKTNTTPTRVNKEHRHDTISKPSL